VEDKPLTPVGTTEARLKPEADAVTETHCCIDYNYINIQALDDK